MESVNRICICPIAELPVEILIAILYLLDGKSILRCCLVCRVWRDAIKISTELQYTIELWADGMVPGDSGNIFSPQRLERLYKWRRAWQNLRWTSRTDFSINQHPRAYELVGGVFAQQSTWPQSDFTAIWLHSAEIISNDNIGIKSLDFAMDPTQDLVVFLHVDQYADEVGNLVCRTMSSLQPHPLASAPKLSFDLRNDVLRRIFLQVADDTIGLLFRTSNLEEAPLRLVLFNWRTGVLLVDFADPQFPPFMADFAFLSPRAYILTCANNSAYLPGRPTGIGEINIYKFDGTCHDDPTRVATLQLPQIDPKRSLYGMIAHSGPFCAGPVPGAPFSKSNDQRICVISLVYDGSEFYSVYVHHRYLEKYLTNEGTPPTVPWDEWGPQNSRMLPIRHRFWLRYVHGERVVCPVDMAHPKRVEIMDFGIIPSRLGLEEEPSGSAVTELCTESSTIPSDGSAFKDDVTTSLPYRRTARELDKDYVLFLIDQDRIIGVNESVNKLSVYTF
ncbi:hypothetical protein C8R44DRAFT_808603 [Mycena epipterygia]|nr:hypothetical protein C8R44DRAFT_808603 [Mycena epipterygia]